MATCVICRARTNLMLFELREPLCAPCLEALREVDLYSAVEPEGAPQAPPRS